MTDPADPADPAAHDPSEPSGPARRTHPVDPLSLAFGAAFVAMALAALLPAFAGRRPDPALLCGLGAAAWGAGLALGLVAAALRGGRAGLR